jgi:hypothetical protein
MKVKIINGINAKYRVKWERNGDIRAKCVHMRKFAVGLACGWSFDQKYRDRSIPERWQDMPRGEYYSWLLHRFRHMWGEYII